MEGARPRMTAFLESLSREIVPAAPIDLPPEELEVSVDEYHVLVGIISRTLPKLKQWATSNGKIEKLDYPLLDSLSSILNQIDAIDQQIASIKAERKQGKKGEKGETPNTPKR